MENDKQLNLSELLKQLETALKQYTKPQVNGQRSAIEPSANLALLIKRTRVEQKLSQKQLGALAGLSSLTITKLENGNRRVSLENVEKVLSALGKSFWIR